MRIASSTACLLRTGNEPGRPRHVGHTLVFGSSPNMFGQPQNSFVLVLSSQCTSSPITISHPSGKAPSAAALLPARRRLRNNTGSPSAGASTCTPIGSPSSPTPNGTLIAGSPHRFDGIVHTSLRYIANGFSVLAPKPNAVVGAVGDNKHVVLLVRRGEVAGDERTHLERLAVVGVVVASRQRVRAEHDAALHFGAEARRRGWPCTCR